MSSANNFSCPINRCGNGKKMEYLRVRIWLVLNGFTLPSRLRGVSNKGLTVFNANAVMTVNYLKFFFDCGANEEVKTAPSLSFLRNYSISPANTLVCNLRFETVGKCFRVSHLQADCHMSLACRVHPQQYLLLAHLSWICCLRHCMTSHHWHEKKNEITSSNSVRTGWKIEN